KRHDDGLRFDTQARVGMYSEDELLPISGLQHILFCERQYALIHIEQLWEENRFTAEGKVLHERVDAEHHESRRLFRQEYGMAVRSLERGMIGKCDLVELYLAPGGGVAEAVPVEFKRGKSKEEDVDRVQLCAQGFCLEEMLGVTVEQGQLYYLQEHRRTTVDLDGPLRAKTMKLVERIRRLQSEGETPPAIYEKRKCDRCSLFDLCIPKAIGNGGKRVDRFVQSEIAAMRRECSS
ncbi:MAG: CRISPR-associated protein Cas4, partial [Rectinema sp.]